MSRMSRMSEPQSPVMFHIGDDDDYTENQDSSSAEDIQRLREGFDMLERRHRGLALSFQRDLTLVAKDVSVLQESSGCQPAKGDPSLYLDEIRSVANFRITEELDDPTTIQRYLRESVESVERISRQQLDHIEARWCVKLDALDKRCQERLSSVEIQQKMQTLYHRILEKESPSKSHAAPCLSDCQASEDLLLKGMLHGIEASQEQRLAMIEARCCSAARQQASEVARAAVDEALSPLQGNLDSLRQLCEEQRSFCSFRCDELQRHVSALEALLRQESQRPVAMTVEDGMISSMEELARSVQESADLASLRCQEQICSMGLRCEEMQLSIQEQMDKFDAKIGSLAVRCESMQHELSSTLNGSNSMDKQRRIADETTAQEMRRYVEERLDEVTSRCEEKIGSLVQTPARGPRTPRKDVEPAAAIADRKPLSSPSFPSFPSRKTPPMSQSPEHPSGTSVELEQRLEQRRQGETVFENAPSRHGVVQVVPPLQDSLSDMGSSCLWDAAANVGARQPKEERLEPGAPVRIHGLHYHTELNGLTGAIEDFDSEKGVWSVSLDYGGTKRVRPSNLERRDDSRSRSDSSGKPTACASDDACEVQSLSASDRSSSNSSQIPSEL